MPMHTQSSGPVSPGTNGPWAHAIRTLSHEPCLRRLTPCAQAQRPQGLQAQAPKVHESKHHVLRPQLNESRSWTPRPRRPRPTWTHFQILAPLAPGSSELSLTNPITHWHHHLFAATLYQLHAHLYSSASSFFQSSLSAKLPTQR